MTLVLEFAQLLATELKDVSRADMRVFQASPWKAVDDGILAEQRLMDMFAQAYDMTVIEDLLKRTASQDFISTIPIDYARRYCMIGIESPATGIQLAVCDPHQIDAIDDVVRLTGQPVDICLACREDILEAVNKAYEKRVTAVDEVIDQWDTGALDEELQTLSESDDLLDMAHRAPVVKFVNSVLFEAIRHHASDIHIQPGEDQVQIRFRVDGVLYDRMTAPLFLLAPVVSRLKIMGRMNVSERRLPQDGRCTARIGTRIVDLRISSIPCSCGERMVLRLLDKSGALFSLEQLGMPVFVRDQFEKQIASSHGIVLITGPTGSGKTTTLYGALQKLQSTELNILTLEDPIEYQLEGISQMQINTKKGVTFASGLRHILRQDPDIIMVGEIRDEETARMAVQSSLTGHLVFATLHTNDAPGAIARLLDLDVEPFLVASSLLGVLGQRLVRRLCPRCRVAYEPNETERRELSSVIQAPNTMDAIYHEKGCPECLQRGFVGREGIFELLVVTQAIRNCIISRENADKIRQAAIAEGFQSLRRNGLQKIVAGITTFNEVVRVTLRDEE